MLELLAYTALFWVVMPALIWYIGKFIVRYTVEAPSPRDLRNIQTETRVNSLRPATAK